MLVAPGLGALLNLTRIFKWQTIKKQQDPQPHGLEQIV
jgi:hypothetical protein